MCANIEIETKQLEITNSTISADEYVFSDDPNPGKANSIGGSFANLGGFCSQYQETAGLQNAIFLKNDMNSDFYDEKQFGEGTPSGGLGIFYLF